MSAEQAALPQTPTVRRCLVECMGPALRVRPPKDSRFYWCRRSYHRACWSRVEAGGLVASGAASGRNGCPERSPLRQIAAGHETLIIRAHIRREKEEALHESQVKRRPRRWLRNSAVVLAGLAYCAVLAVVVTWRFPGPGILQPDRADAVRLSLTPADDQFYQHGVADNLQITAKTEALGWLNYLGFRPRTILEITQHIAVSDPQGNRSWQLSLSQAFEYSVLTHCANVADDVKCEFTEWKSWPANTPLTFDTTLVSPPGAPPDDPPHISWLRINIRVATLARSEELEGDDLVDFSSLQWVERSGPELYYPPEEVRGRDETEGLRVGNRTMRELIAESSVASAVQLWLCPSCMAIRTYECSDERTKGEYYCLGTTDQPHTISWSAIRVDAIWRRGVADWVLAGLVGAGVVAAFAGLRRRARPTDASGDSANTSSVPKSLTNVVEHYSGNDSTGADSSPRSKRGRFVRPHPRRGRRD